MGTFGIEQVVLKNKKDRAYIASLRDPARIEGHVISARLIDDINRRFNKEYPEPTTKREFKKAKKREKSFLHTKTIEIDPKRFKRFAIVFFTLIFVGGIISWIFLAAKNIKVADHFNLSGIEWVTVVNSETGSTSVQRDVNMNAAVFVQKKQPNSFGLLEECRLSPKEAGLAIDTISFSIVAKGSGEVLIEIEVWDPTKMEPGSPKVVSVLTNKGNMTMQNGKPQKMSASINHTFTQFNEQSYIVIRLKFSENSIKNFAVFNLSAKKM